MATKQLSRRLARLERHAGIGLDGFTEEELNKKFKTFLIRRNTRPATQKRIREIDINSEDGREILASMRKHFKLKWAYAKR